jgi:hypothetical protein
LTRKASPLRRLYHQLKIDGINGVSIVMVGWMGVENCPLWNIIDFSLIFLGVGGSKEGV